MLLLLLTSSVVTYGMIHAVFCAAALADLHTPGICSWISTWASGYIDQLVATRFSLIDGLLVSARETSLDGLLVAARFSLIDDLLVVAVALLCSTDFLLPLGSILFDRWTSCYCRCSSLLNGLLVATRFDSL